jgi:2-polyprenyl-3-methyl-5-hydroxy-6-metoxy-1,4-benzoquinol methylase
MKTINHKHCPLCLSSKISFFLKSRDFLVTNKEFELWRCGSCGFVFTQDIPAEEEIGKYYQSKEYVSHSDTRKGLINKLYHFGRKMMLRKKFRMVSEVAPGRKLLDIGCGTGYFPAYMKERGFEVAGVEVDPAAREFAKQTFAIPVYSPEEFLNHEIEVTFDFITMWNVLEHVEDFDHYLEKMSEHLAPGGSLIFALPNCSAYDARHYKEIWAAYDVPRHLWHFTPSTFEMLLQKHALKITRMKRLVLDPFYNSILSERHKGNKLSMMSGFLFGTRAHLEGLMNIRRASSVVYFVNRLDEEARTQAMK